MDWTFKVTDIIMIVAIFAGPIVAVQLAEILRKKQDVHRRRVHIFRTLMATRISPLALRHIESLNLVELEFRTGHQKDKKVVDCWKLYLAHLTAFHSYQPQVGWEQRRYELLVDLLFEMGLAIGYSFDKSEIKIGAYSPQGYLDADFEVQQSRKLWLEILRGERPLPMTAFQSQAPQAPSDASIISAKK